MLYHFPQECSGNYKFNSQLYMTRGFLAEFGDVAPIIALSAIKLIKDRVNNAEGADYLQVFEMDSVRFWVIDSLEYVTILLPTEY